MSCARTHTHTKEDIPRESWHVGFFFPIEPAALIRLVLGQKKKYPDKQKNMSLGHLEKTKKHAYSA